MEFFRKLFDTADFPERWHCGSWELGHGWLHIISDTAIFGAYVAIPIALLLVAWQSNRGILKEPLTLLFSAFILSCGIGHLIEASIFWHPWYRLSGVVKAITAVVSWATFVAIARNLPTALRVPDMIQQNRQLRDSVKEQAAIADELSRSNEDLNQFAFVASHDMKAPLRSIRNLANWISEDSGDLLPEESKRHLDQMHSRIERLDNLLEDLLTYSRAGQNLSDPEEVDVEKYVLRIFQDLETISGDIELKTAGNLTPVFTWGVPLDQILRNLIGNAVKHHKTKKGEVIVRGRKVPSGLWITVEDDGPGIEEKYFDRIFKMFQTLQSKDDVEGSGIGLAVVKKLVERLGGEIELESEFGEGSKFRIFIPHQQSPVLA